ncbi:hypothetical protein Tco_1393610 [Tanacetum coccineum]
MESECLSNSTQSIRSGKEHANPQSFAYFSFLFAVHVVGIITFLLGAVPPLLVKDHGGVFTILIIVSGSTAVLASGILILASLLLPSWINDIHYTILKTTGSFSEIVLPFSFGALVGDWEAGGSVDGEVVGVGFCWLRGLGGLMWGSGGVFCWWEYGVCGVVGGVWVDLVLVVAFGVRGRRCVGSGLCLSLGMVVGVVWSCVFVQLCLSGGVVVLRCEEGWACGGRGGGVWGVVLCGMSGVGSWRGLGGVFVGVGSGVCVGWRWGVVGDLDWEGAGGCCVGVWLGGVWSGLGVVLGLWVVCWAGGIVYGVCLRGVVFRMVCVGGVGRLMGGDCGGCFGVGVGGGILGVGGSVELSCWVFDCGGDGLCCVVRGVCGDWLGGVMVVVFSVFGGCEGFREHRGEDGFDYCWCGGLTVMVLSGWVFGGWVGVGGAVGFVGVVGWRGCFGFGGLGFGRVVVGFVGDDGWGVWGVGSFVVVWCVGGGGGLWGWVGVWDVCVGLKGKWVVGGCLGWGAVFEMFGEGRGRGGGGLGWVVGYRAGVVGVLLGGYVILMVGCCMCVGVGWG